MKNRTSKKSILTIIAVCIIIETLTIAAVFITGGNYTAYINNQDNYDKVTVEYSKEGIVKMTNVSSSNGVTKLEFKGLKTGKSTVKVKLFDPENELNHTGILYEFTVLPTGVVYLSGCDFGGFQFVVLGLALLTLFAFVIFIKQFRYRKKVQFFSYKTVIDLTLLIYFGFQSLMYFAFFAGCVLYPHLFDGWRVYNLAGLGMIYLFILILPIVILFALFLTVSNINLIRREGLSKNNLFGIFISLILLTGSLACVIATIRNPNTISLELKEISGAISRSVISSAFVYFEILLFSTLICTQYAAKHKPKLNQDFIIILGCKIKKDGTPTPLLKGRINRAIDFYKKQTEDTGYSPCFIPSGGKGSDEIISEAECMKNYLIEQGFDESVIFPETRSTNTLENMKYSKEIADSLKENSNILFSTTNYHVFRSGIYSATAGLKADGVGSKTKWYFWPNAQMREFVGILVSEWATTLVFILLTVLLSTLFANISTIINLIVK